MDDPKPPAAPISDAQLKALLKRYSDGYLLAHEIIRFGSIVQGASVVIGILVAVGDFYFVSQIVGRGDYASPMIVAVVLSVLAGGLVYIAGVLVSAAGQILLASLDTAVHTSPFLAHHHRARVMSLS